MPFTASLGSDRKRTGLAPCTPFLENGKWEEYPWQVRVEYCRTCPFRFTHQPSCSLDFLTFSSIDSLKQELATALSWLGRDPSWTTLNGAQFEADLAYYMLGKKPPTPKKAFQDFIEKFLVATPGAIEKFRGLWGHAVEGYEGKPFTVDVTASNDYLSTAQEMIASWMQPRKFSGPALHHLYAAVSVLEDAAANLDLVQLKEAMSLLVEAGRRSISAQSSLEVS